MSNLKDKEEQYSIFLQYKEKKKKEPKNYLRMIKSLLFIIAILAVIGFTVYFLDKHYNLLTVIENKTGIKLSFSVKNEKNELMPSKFNFNMLSRYQNILLLGVDSNGPNTLPYSGVRSDTIIILNADLKGKSVNAISIPRDSKVYLADEHGVQKINSAYAFGGIDLTKKTIEEAFGIKIHNYIIVNAEGIRKIIDAIGGVPIHIDQSMHYVDKSAKLNINFEKGDYILDGKQSEEYLRFRKDMLGDIGRVHRQQKFIKAFIEKLKSPETVRKIPEAIKIAGLYTRTDLNLYQISQYATIARELDMNKVEFVMLPGAPNKKGIISYWILDPEKTQQIIDRLIYRKKDPQTEIQPTAGIIYSNSRELDANAIRTALKNEGYDVNCTGRSSSSGQSEIIGHNGQITIDKIRMLQKNIPEISDLNFIHNPVRNYCSESDLVITLKDKE